MSQLTYTIDINAPKEKVWDTMLQDKTYRQWTAAFHEGSYYQGSWDKGSEIRFLAEDDGKVSGMNSHIVENIPHEYISIEHLGEVIDGKDVFDTPDAQQWAGSHENYIFKENDGVTNVTVRIDGPEVSAEMTEMFAEMWPPALQKLKQLAELA